MISALAKLIPLATIVGGAAASSPKLKAQIAKVMQTTEVVATQQEISEISKMVYIDTIDGTHPRVENFESYLKTNMRTTNGTQRDTSKDQWGQAYRLAYSRLRNELVVSSAGPDQQHDTADDIRGSYPLESGVQI